ncbi:MAG: hypothetical protein LBM69_10650 [Lachnospiraceae bacterium]|nr:hypothetical protein [Lachnospiraceae bacterium]
MAIALYPLHKIARLRRIVVSTYQSVSGHSGAGMDQPTRQERRCSTAGYWQKMSA